jgi:hypothetical protein
MYKITFSLYSAAQLQLYMGNFAANYDVKNIYNNPEYRFTANTRKNIVILACNVYYSLE